MCDVLQKVNKTSGLEHGSQQTFSCDPCLIQHFPSYFKRVGSGALNRMTLAIYVKQMKVCTNVRTEELSVANEEVKAQRLSVRLSDSPTQHYIVLCFTIWYLNPTSYVVMND